MLAEGCIATLGQVCGDRARVPLPQAPAGDGTFRMTNRHSPVPGTLASNLTYNLSGKELQ